VVDELEQAFSSLVHFLGELKSRLLGPVPDASNEAVKEASSLPAASAAPQPLPILWSRGSSELLNSSGGNILIPTFPSTSYQPSGSRTGQDLLHPMKLDWRIGVQEVGFDVREIRRAEDRSV
jgi:hypothetical protein